MSSDYPLPSSDPASLGFAARPLEHLDALIRAHIEEGRYPGAQIALARHGKLALFRTYGDARTEGARQPATNQSLFLLFSQTKVLTSAAVWTLVEQGQLSFMDKVADHLPEFAARGKADITLHQVMTHQGGFPSADVSRASWADHARMRAEVCDFSLEWTPGSRLQYHGACGASGAGDADRGRHRPGLPRRHPPACHRAAWPGRRHLRRRAVADAASAAPIPTRRNRATTRQNSAPRGCRTAAASPPPAAWRRSTRCLAMAGGWAMCGCSRRGCSPMSRATTPASAATCRWTASRCIAVSARMCAARATASAAWAPSARRRPSGTAASGSSYSWADPTSGVSFTYLSNYVVPDPWHSARLDRISNLVHAAID